MIPLRLTIEGVHSYQKKQEIDFEYLTEAGLFGIFGKVGSGKSSILEAITVVLYGQNDRLNKTERNYNLTNLGADGFVISFEFITEADQQKYRFDMKGTRNKKRFEDIKVVRDAYRWQLENNTWLPMDDVNADRILDLTYDDFKRTIIIPQGKFQDFLEMKITERTAMLQNLFKLEKYNLSDKTNKLFKANELDITALEGQLLGIGTATPQELEDKNQALHKANTLLQTYENNNKTLREQAKVQEELKKLFDDLFKATEQLENLRQQEQNYQKRTQELSDFQAAQQHIEPVIAEQKKLLSEQKKTQQELTQVQQTLQSIEQDFAETEKNYQLLKPQYQQRDQLKVKGDELKKILKISELTTEIAKCKDRIKNGTQKLEALKLTIANHKKQRSEYQDKVQKTQAQSLDTERISAIKSWFDQYKKLKEDKGSILKEGLNLNDEGTELDAQKTKILTKSLIDKDLTKHSLAEIESIFEAHRQEFLQKSEALDPQKLALQTRLAIQAHAAVLSDGQPCPMCGSVHHPAPLTVHEDLNQTIKTIENQQVELKKKADNLAKTTTELGKVFIKIEGINKQKEDIKARFEKAKNKITHHESEFVWEDFQKDKPNKVEEVFEQNKKIKAQIESDLSQIKMLDLSIDQDENKKTNDYENPLTRLITENEGSVNRQQALSKEIMIFDCQTELSKGLDYINAQIQHFDFEYVNVEKKYLGIETKFDKLKVDKQKHSTDLAVLQDRSIGQQLALETLAISLQNALANTHFETLAQAQQILAKGLAIATEQKAINQFLADLDHAQKQYFKLRDQTQNQVFEEDKLLEAKGLIVQNEQSIKEITQQQGALQSELENLKKDLEKQADLRKQIDVLKLRADDLKTLVEMFRANGFVNYVSTVYLQNLCNQANVRFHQMTRQQLQLELSDKNEFLIRDFLNGGKTRAAASLSGGQKFQASLALALALADSIQKSGQKNFFFLDEGFGSLDKDSLKIVFETLKSLRQENRIVGLISHVEDLQNEMDRGLHIHNDEQLGSLVHIF